MIARVRTTAELTWHKAGKLYTTPPGLEGVIVEPTDWERKWRPGALVTDVDGERKFIEASDLEAATPADAWAVYVAMERALRGLTEAQQQAIDAFETEWEKRMREHEDADFDVPRWLSRARERARRALTDPSLEAGEAAE